MTLHSTIDSSSLPGDYPDRWRVFFLVAVGIFMSTLDGSIVNIAVPIIMKELQVSVVAVQWVIMIYLLVVTSLLFSFGRLSDIYGRRRVYGVGLLVEQRAAHSILDRELFRIRLFALPILAAIILFASLFSLVFLVPFYLLNPCGYAVDHAGYLMATIFVFLFIVSPISGTLSDHIGSRLLCTCGTGIMAVSLYMIFLLHAGASVGAIVWRLALAGIGVAVFIPPNSATAMNSVPPQRRGIASATVAAARNLGMVLGVGVSGAVFNSTFLRLSHGISLKVYRPALEPIFMKAFHAAMLNGVLIALAGVVISFLRGPEPRTIRH